MIKIFGLLFALLCFPAYAFDDTAQCPGGSSPRPDILACYGFDAVVQCVTGFESGCAIANSIGNMSEHPYTEQLHVAQDAPAVGKGYLSHDFRQWGGTGASVAHSYPALGREFALRFYFRFGPGASDFQGSVDHALYVIADGGGKGCKSTYQGVIIDWASSGAAFFPNATCSGGAQTLWSQRMLPGRWYLVELYGVVETACVNNQAIRGCDGRLTAYVDGVMQSDFRDWNWCGGGACRFASFYLPVTYFNSGFPPWGYRKDYDALVIGSAASQRIGPADAENVRGVGVTSYPILNAGGIAAFVFVPQGPGCDAVGGCVRHEAGDCAATSIAGTRSKAAGWAAAPLDDRFQFDPNKNHSPVEWIKSAGNCARGVDSSLRLDVATGQTGDIVIADSLGQGALGTRHHYVGGSVMLDAGYASKAILLGMRGQGSTGCSTTYCEWVGLTVQDGKFALRYFFWSLFAATVDKTFWVGPAATTGVWHRVELGFGKNTALVTINGTTETVAVPVAQLGGPQSGSFFGAAKIRTVEPIPFRAWFDMMYSSNVSRVACSMPGWGPECAQLRTLDGWGTYVPPPPATPKARVLIEWPSTTQCTATCEVE